MKMASVLIERNVVVGVRVHVGLVHVLAHHLGRGGIIINICDTTI